VAFIHGDADFREEVGGGCHSRRILDGSLRRPAGGGGEVQVPIDCLMKGNN
jgi:hypothetical protein